MSLESGSILNDRYRIESQLGKGGMGAVYLGFDQTLDIKVAVKENLNVNPESERQFMREARLLASLRHPNLPRVTDYFILEGRQYLVMDYIEGEDLHGRAHHHPPTIDEVLSWAEGVCDALHYLHAKDPPIIHRDIKPANLKLQPDGRVLLVDFGIAKVFDKGQATTTGARGLTPGYSPPEQYGGTRTDERSDQYALAATMYALLTRRSPVDSIERMLKKEELESPRQVNPSIPQHVEQALMRAMELDQDDRFPDVATFKKALQGKLPIETVPAAKAEVATVVDESSMGKTVVEPATMRATVPGETGPPAVQAPTAVSLGESLPVARKRGIPVGLLAIGGIGIIGIAVVAFALFGGGIDLGGLTGGGSDDPEVSGVVDPLTQETPTPTEIPASPTPEPTQTPIPATEVPTPSPTETQVEITLGGGGRIAFASDRGEGFQLQIWTINPDGSDPRQLTFGPGDKTEPKWSPDRRRLLYVADGGQDEFGNDQGLDIFVINADGTGVNNLTSNVGDDIDPSWSPDGSKIAFAGDRINDLNQVFIMNVICGEPPESCSAAEGRPTNISAGYAVEYSPAWSPDGRTLYVSASINQAPGRIFWRPIQGGEPTRFDRSDTIIGADDLVISPDGSLIAFTWVQPTMNEVYSVLMDDYHVWTRLTRSLGNKDPDFSPDGQLIVFTSTRDQNSEIYIMTFSGANQENLTNSPGSQDLQPDW
jgi:predicted Ser/Thr protein kinase